MSFVVQTQFGLFMRENRHFVRSTDISGRTPALIDGAPAVNAYHLLIERLEKRAGARCRCTLRRAGSSDQRCRPQCNDILVLPSWKAPVVELASIDEVARKPVVEKLSARLRCAGAGLG